MQLSLLHADIIVVPVLLCQCTRPPFPGVPFQMGHSANGKAAETYQKCCQGLARLGYLVLAFDPMGQGERIYCPRPGGVVSRLRSPTDEHTVGTLKQSKAAITSR